LWIPDIDTTKFAKILLAAVDKKGLVHVFNDGSVYQSWRMTLFIPHKFNLQDYPNDKQRVEFDLESWS